MAFFNEFPHTRNYDSDLGWLIKHVKKLLEKAQTEDEQLEILTEFMNQINSGDFPEPMLEALNRWAEENMIEILGRYATNVFFGLTSDGHFVAYIPDTWDGIVFNTTEYDINIPTFTEYGHLVLSY